MGYYQKWKFIVLKFESKCADCGSTLPVGTKAKWYFRSRKVYGVGCHKKSESTYRQRPRTAYQAGDRSEGAIASHFDRKGVYSVDGRKIGSTPCNCEDRPCCGCDQ